MKARFTSLFLLLATPLLHAQATPTLMSYQGRVTDVAGVLIGNTTPVNRAVIFKLYSESSGGTVLYAETQSVTISGGEFSVLIGNGTGISTLPGPSSPATTPYKTLSEIVNSSAYANLYLGVTVDDGTNAVDLEISPRQQMVSGVFALRAKVAESVAGSAITTSMLGDGQVSTGKIASGAVNSSRILDLSIVSTDIANSTITSAKLDTTTVGVWTPVGSSVYRNGNVGIGEVNPGFPLNFGTQNLGDRISLWGNSGSTYGFGIQNALLQIHSADPGSDVAFGYGSSAAMTETMRIKGSGNVGIGTSTPAEKLVVAGTAQAERLYSNGVVRARGGSYGANGTNAGFSFDGDGDSDGGMFSGADGTLQFYTNGTEKLRIATDGSIGVQTTAPNAKLSIGGTLGSAAGNNLVVHGGSLGNAAGSEVKIASFGLTTASASSLTVSGYRRAANGGWENSAFILGMNVDSTMRAGGWMGLTNSGVGVQTLDTSQGVLSVGGGITAVGSRSGGVGYARMMYSADRSGIAFEVYNTGQGGTTNWRNFSFDGDSNLDFYSDRRLKKDIVSAEPMLDRLMELPFRRFRWKDNDDAGQKHEFGVIAQEVQPLFPDLIGEGNDGTLTVGYGTFGTIACKSIQELKVQVDGEMTGVREQLDEKDRKIADLEARLAALEKMMQSAQ